MTLPSYDPAIAANIVSVIALLFAWLSYRLSRKTTIARTAASLPDVASSIAAVKGQPGWYNLRIEVKNNSSSDMTIERATFLRGAGGISTFDATLDDEIGSRSLKPDLNAVQTRKTIEFGYRVGPKGSNAHPHGLRAGERNWIDFYVKSEASSAVAFDLEFSWRSTDVRRSSRHVSRQRVIVPARQVS